MAMSDRAAMDLSEKYFSSRDTGGKGEKKEKKGVRGFLLL